MLVLRGLTRQLTALICSGIIVATALGAQVQAREVHIAFIEDGSAEPQPRLAELLSQELQPLLNSGDLLVPVYLGSDQLEPNPTELLKQAINDPKVDYIVATGYLSSQAIYQQPRFAKPTYLLQVVNPELTGVPAREKVRNLRFYSTTNAMTDVFERISTLFKAKRVGIALPIEAMNASRSIGPAVNAAAKRAGLEATFLGLDFSADLNPQITDIDAIILPPYSHTDDHLKALLDTLRRKKIPSFAVGGESMVLKGALISDTQSEDLRVLARRVALDLQLAIAGETGTSGARWLEPKRHTTINIDTARAIGVDFALDDIMSARIVQNNTGLTLGFLSVLELAEGRNLELLGQQQQLQVDDETLEQSRAARRPQLSASISSTLRGEQLPERDTMATVAVQQSVYSPTKNADVDSNKLNLEASRLDLQQQRISTISQTASAYFQALQTQSQLDISLRNLALNRENLSLAEQRERSGSGSGADIYRWQATIASSETATLNAYTTNVSAQNQLAQLLNTRLQVPVSLAQVDLDQPPFDLLHQAIEPYLQSTGGADRLREISAEISLQQSLNLQSAQRQSESLEVGLRALKRAYYTPELSLSGQYYRYLDSSANGAGVELDGDNDWSLSLNAELPLWLGGQRSSLIRQQQARVRATDNQIQALRIGLWADSGNAVVQLVSNYRAIALSQRAEEAARKSHQITQRAYKLGSASVTDLLDTQNSYSEAQDNAQVARYQYLNALVSFQALMGELPMLESGAQQQQWLQSFEQKLQ